MFLNYEHDVDVYTQVGGNTFVFFVNNNDRTTMLSVDATGTIIDNRWVHGSIDVLTVAIWKSAFKLTSPVDSVKDIVTGYCGKTPLG